MNVNLVSYLECANCAGLGKIECEWCAGTGRDGTIWNSFAGYGVGEGFDEIAYGYSTAYCEKRLKELFPDSFEGDMPQNPITEV